MKDFCIAGFGEVMLRLAPAGKKRFAQVLPGTLEAIADLTKKFDEWGVQFVAVTHEINTRTSSGRMMLNILMTFAQFEREILTERVRDKVAAAKKRGKQCGGYPVLGYDSAPITKKLHINEAEAETVKYSLLYRTLLQSMQKT